MIFCDMTPLGGSNYTFRYITPTYVIHPPFERIFLTDYDGDVRIEI